MARAHPPTTEQAALALVSFCLGSEAPRNPLVGSSGHWEPPQIRVSCAFFHSRYLWGSLATAEVPVLNKILSLPSVTGGSVGCSEGWECFLKGFLSRLRMAYISHT